MNRSLLLLLCSSALACAADLGDVQSVYVMPMTRGLDQYLASRLASEHVFQVVSDAKLADALFTSRIGEGFTASLDQIAPQEQPKAAEEGQTAGNKLDNPALNSTFGGGKGTLFLVDAKTREVVWSTFEAPKGSSPSEMDRMASDIVSRLKRELKKK